MKDRISRLLLGLIISLVTARSAESQTLQESLEAVAPADLVRAARGQGDAKRGAVVFYQPLLQCTRCHVADKKDNLLGPDLTQLPEDATDVHLVESVLAPSKLLRKGYEPVTILTATGDIATGLLVSDDDTDVVARVAEQDFKQVTFKKDDLISVEPGDVSIMPAGQMNFLRSRQEFLDLILYLIEIRDGGPDRARELEPPPSLYATRPLPEYEKRVDHAGILESLDRDAFKRGEKTYNTLCINCHGTHDAPGSLPTSLKFAKDPFKNGSDPYSMYRTLTHGFGMMVAQTWMVPTQKYDVIHYVREDYLKSHNPTQHFKLSPEYLAELPEGDTRGPDPVNIVPWEQMDYGPNLVMTLEVGNNAKNFAYKGNVIRLDGGPGGVSKGRYWMVYDYDTLRVAAAWTGESFTDWNGINFNGRHAIHPRLAGEVHLANPTGPGWGRPEDGSFEDVRLVGRDGRIYGPLPRPWAQYKGMYYHGQQTIVQYTVGRTEVLETPGVLTAASRPVYTRTINIAPNREDLVLQVAHRDESGMELDVTGATAVFGPVRSGSKPKPEEVATAVADVTRFNGGSRVELADTSGLHVKRGDFTVTARIKTTQNGTIVAQTAPSSEWVQNGMTWFVRGGRLAVDIGWVGAFGGQLHVSDGKWHDVAFSYEQGTGTIRLYVDGKPEKRTGRLERKGLLQKPVLRVGYTAANFPNPSPFKGEISRVCFYNAVLNDDEVKKIADSSDASHDALAAHWDLSVAQNNVVADKSGRGHDAKVIVGEAAPTSTGTGGWTVAGLEGDTEALEWVSTGENLRLKIPARKEHRRFTLWFSNVQESDEIEAIAESVVLDEPAEDLRRLTHGGPSRWPDVLTTEAVLGDDDGPFAVDVLTHPEDNPWFCRMRLTGFDFSPDGDKAYVSAWDGTIWLVTGLGHLPQKTPEGDARRIKITWRRIASGLFQPLGLKIVDGKIYVTCRDQLCVLHDLNGDDEIDYFESFNNDHQVTDHFHEFAMGLQADAEGNFYYAKSARHALTALVPHHGTLLRISKDGSRTDILANGFRAANGICINPDGSFIVTDQEGHWTPKNRINYVKLGGFYGNMFGYHDVEDSADDAMEQPLCWITNSFDRSPSELMWVDSERWGPLNGKLLNFSYGYGMVYVVPHEKLNGQEQGGMCAFPIPRFPTGVMRGRFHPRDGQLYTCGMFSWAGNQTQPGGFYRLRYTGKPVHLPIDLKATKTGMTIEFSGELDRETATDASKWAARIWGLNRTRNYGSKHVDEHPIEVTAVELDKDGRTVHLEIPEIVPTWGMEIRYRIRSAEGKPIDGNIHNTIHNLGG